jgi:hypothetical protein
MFSEGEVKSPYFCKCGELCNIQIILLYYNKSGLVIGVTSLDGTIYLYFTISVVYWQQEMTKNIGCQISMEYNIQNCLNHYWIFNYNYIYCREFGKFLSYLPLFTTMCCFLCTSVTTSLSGELYSIQHYVIMFVSDLRHVSDFLRILQFPPPVKLTTMI